MYRTIALALAVAAFAQRGLSGQFDWPQWQGPDRTAHSKETGLLKEWPKDGPPLAWKVKALGGGDSTPSIAKGRIYGMSHRGADEIVWALSEKDGAEVWAVRIAPAQPQNWPQSKEGPSATPTVDGDRLYVMGLAGNVACLQAADGRVIWQRSLVADFEGRSPMWSFRESPLVDGDKVIGTPGGEEATMVALNKLTGTELRFERSHPVSIAGVCSRTFGDALQRLARYKQLTCPEEIRVHRKAEEASVEFFFIEATEAQPDIMVDLGLSWILCVGQRGSDGQITPLRLEVTRPVKHRALLERHFGCRARFNADRNALVFRSSDLDRPFVTHNEELVQIIGTHLDADLKAAKTSLNVGQQVKDTLKRSLAGKRPTLQDVAQELGMSTRTLQRRLTDAGFTFQQLVEETRRELARHYLKQRAVELPEAAFLLGFEDANSFFRAFQRWEGTSPTEWRSRLNSGPAKAGL